MIRRWLERLFHHSSRVQPREGDRIREIERVQTALVQETEALRSAQIGDRLAKEIQSWLDTESVGPSGSSSSGIGREGAREIESGIERGKGLLSLSAKLREVWSAFALERESLSRIAPRALSLLESCSPVFLLVDQIASEEALGELERSIDQMAIEARNKCTLLERERDDWTERLRVLVPDQGGPAADGRSSPEDLERAVNEVRSEYRSRSSDLLVKAGEVVDRASAAQLEAGGRGEYRVWQGSRPRSGRFFLDRLEALQQCGEEDSGVGC